MCRVKTQLRCAQFAAAAAVYGTALDARDVAKSTKVARIESLKLEAKAAARRESLFPTLSPRLRCIYSYETSAHWLRV